MNIRIESVTGMLLKSAYGDKENCYRFAAQCFQECVREPGCPYPFRIRIDDDEYFEEDVSWMLEYKG